MCLKLFSFLLLIAVGLLFLPLNGEEKNNRPDPKVIPVSTKQPEENKPYPIAIIGAGAAGTMAVKRAILNNNETLLFAGANQERRRSRGNWVRKVDNVPGLSKYERTILELRNETLQELVQGPLGHNLYLVEDSIISIKKDDNGYFILVDGAGRTYYATYVVMATGIMDEQPHIQGSIRPILKYANGQTVAYCALCDGHRSVGKKTLVIGHKDSAASVALLLQEKYPLESMCIVTNGHPPDFTFESTKKLENRYIPIYQSPILEVLGDPESKQFAGFKLESGEVVEAEIGFVSLGIRPNNQLALQLDAEVDSSGLVLTDAIGESSIPNLFIVGDLRANSSKQIYTAWQQAFECLQLINRRLRK